MEENSNAIIDWLTSSGLTIAIILGVVYAVRKFGNQIIKRAIRKAISSNNFTSEKAEQQREDTLISIIQATMRVALWITAGMLIVQELGVDIGPLVAGASVIGVALGFGAQSLVKDFVSGVFIIAENQYRVDDVISIAGVSGVVQGITMRETILRDMDGNVHHVPNGLIDVATNMTIEFSNVHMNLGVGYDSDIEKVEKTINEVGAKMAEEKDWKSEIIEPMVFLRVDNFGASEVEVKILGKVKPGSQWKVAGEYRKRIKAAFDKNGIEIPFPQRVIHKG